MKQTPRAQLNRTILDRTIEAAEDAFAQAQHAAKLRDWKAFERFMDDNRRLCDQWRALVS